MKALTIMLLGLAMMVVSAVSHDVYAAEPSQVIAEHLAMAKSYDEKATALDAVIAEHEQMKKDYKSKFFINEKVTPLAGLKKMNDHCDAIIKDAKKLRDEYLESAKWHRMRATELQGK